MQSESLNGFGSIILMQKRIMRPYLAGELWFGQRRTGTAAFE
jgi:hypothetical protein